MPLAGRDKGPGLAVGGQALLVAVPRGPGNAAVVQGQAQGVGQRAFVGRGEAGFFAGAGACRAQAGQ